MSTPSKKRLMRDFRRLQNDPPHGISAAPLQDDIMEWQAVTFGPDDSPWEGGTFKLTLSFTEDYPNKAPKVKFVTKMFHPNIYNDGAICLDILQHNWSPIYDIAAILTSIQSLLTDPNPNSPANVEAAKLYQENRREYERRVQQIVEESWEQDSDDDDENDSDENENDEDDDSDDLDLSDDSDDDNNNTNDKTEKDKDKTKAKEKTKNRSNKNKNKNKTKSNDNNNSNNNINDEKEDIDLDMDDINGNKNKNNGNSNNSNNNNNNVSSNKVDTTDEMNQNDGTMTSAAEAAAAK